MIEYSKMNKDELIAHLDLYRQAKVENVPEFTTKKDAVAWLTNQSQALGIPHVVTAEDVKNQKAQGIDLVEGEVVILPIDSDTEKKEKPEGDEGNKSAPVAQKPSDEQVNLGRPPVAKTISPEPVYFYQGKPVISHMNKINNGKIYYQVVTRDSVALLSEEEFNEFVTIKE